MVALHRAPLPDSTPRPLEFVRNRLYVARVVRRLRATAPVALRHLRAADTLPVTEWSILRAQVTRSGLGVVTFGDRMRRPVVVVKLALADRVDVALQHHARVLADLTGQELPPALLARLPRPIGSGQLEARTFVVETAVDGVPATTSVRDQETRERALGAMAEAIAMLHDATASETPSHDALLAGAVEQPLAELAAIEAVRWTHGHELALIGQELRNAMRPRIERVCWVHGDYWPANVLLDRQTGEVSGIVDWDRSHRGQLPLHDVLHLLLYTRKLVRRAQLGDIVADQLVARRWEPYEERILKRCGVAGDGPEVVTYWLRHVVENLRRDPAYATNDKWIERNILPVLARCANGISA